MSGLYTADWVLPIASAPIAAGAVLVRGGEIAAVGPAAELTAAHPDVEREDFGAAAILPGFINAHTHIEYATYAGFGDGEQFTPWISLHVRRKRALDAAGSLASARLGALMCLRSGTTTIADCAFAGDALAAAAEAGLRGIVYLEAFGGADAHPDAVVRALDERLTALDADRSALLVLGVSPHAPYTVAPNVYDALCRYARARSMPLATHIAESRDELDALRSGTGPIAKALERITRIEVLGEHPVDVLVRTGVLGPDHVAIHAVQVGPEQIRALAAADVPVAHCPRSNALLGCGAAPLAELLDAGVRVGLGTDSPASALDFDVFAELRAAVLGARAREGRADALSARQALRLATLGAAEALGLADRVGALVPGLRADLSVVSLADSAWQPIEDPAAAVVYQGSPERVLVTLVDGVVRYRSATDGERVRQALERAAAARAAMIATAPTESG